VNEPVAAQRSDGLIRIRLDVSYDGTDFSGWAAQPDQRTVQGVLEEALGRQPPGDSLASRTVVAGRTDAGVHADAQVLHVDVVPLGAESTGTRIPVDERGIPDLSRMRQRWNRYLPADVRVTSASIAPGGFDARFAALRRHYRYRVSDAPWGVEPLRRRDTLAWRRPLDVDRLNLAAAPLVGLHDFAAFCKQRAGATTIRKLGSMTWQRCDEHLLVADLSADAFCHSMVRGLVGALLMAGDGRRGIGWPAQVLADQERCSAVAPAHGLRLVSVDYPADEGLADRAAEARSVRSLPGSAEPDQS